MQPQHTNLYNAQSWRREEEALTDSDIKLYICIFFYVTMSEYFVDLCIGMNHLAMDFKIEVFILRNISLGIKAL